jgi:hypothetical protein
MTEAEELLADVRTLRRRTRRDRRASAFPLLLFGALILAAPLCYAPVQLPPPDADGTISFQFFPGPFPLFNGIGGLGSVARYPNLVSWYWFLTVVIGFAATAWWYRRRALGVGVETDTRPYLVASGAALTGFVIGVPLLKFLVPATYSLYSTPSRNLPILFGSAAASAVVLSWASRQNGTTVRAIGLFAGVVLATVAFAAVGVYLIYGFAALLIIATGLLALAWLERNVLLGVIGLTFTAAALLANLFNIPLSWTLEQLRQLVLLNLVLPAAVLLIGGVVVAVKR